jgi:hypothetical protein
MRSLALFGVAFAACGLDPALDPSGACVTDDNGYSVLDADVDSVFSLEISTKGVTTDAFRVDHPGTVGALDLYPDDGRYILACKQVEDLKTVKMTVTRPASLTAFGAEWVQLFPKDSWKNVTNEYEPFSFNEYGAKIPLAEFRPTSTGTADDAADAETLNVFMEVSEEGDYEVMYGTPGLKSGGYWVAVQFKSTLLRVGTPWAECSGAALGEPSYSVGSIMPILFGGPNLNSIALAPGKPDYFDVIAELSGVTVPVKVVLEIFSASADGRTSYTDSAESYGKCYKSGTACPEQHHVCKAEYCEMDVWKQLIAEFKAAGSVTVLGSVDTAATLALYDGLDLDGFYFTDGVVSPGGEGRYMRLTVTKGGTYGSGGFVDGHYCFGGYGGYGFSIFDDSGTRLLPTTVTCTSCRSSYGDAALLGAFTGTSHWCVWSPTYDGVSILDIDFGQTVAMDSYAFDCGGGSNCALSWHIETSDDQVTWAMAASEDSLTVVGGNNGPWSMSMSGGRRTSAPAGTSVVALGSPLFDGDAVDAADVYVTLAAKDLGVWNPFSWYPYELPAKWAAIVTEAADLSAVATLVDRGYGWVYLTSEATLGTKSALVMSDLLAAIEAPTTRRKLQERNLEASAPFWGCDDILLECKPICMKTTGVTTTKVSDSLCADAPMDQCACKCYHEAQWTCDGDSVVCKAKYGAGELETVGDKVCEMRGAPKPTSAAELRTAAGCEPVTEMRGSAPAAECLATWGTAAPNGAGSADSPTAAPPANMEDRLMVNSFATALAFAALALFA